MHSLFHFQRAENFRRPWRLSRPEIVRFARRLRTTRTWMRPGESRIYKTPAHLADAQIWVIRLEDRMAARRGTQLALLYAM